MIAFIVKNWKYLLPVLVIILVIGIVKYIHDRGGDDRENEIAVDTAKKEREVQSEKDRIRNNRGDRAAVIVSLREGSF